MAQNRSTHMAIYVCPRCQGRLAQRSESLDCPACATRYPILDGIPDFLAADPGESGHPVL